MSMKDLREEFEVTPGSDEEDGEDGEGWFSN